LIEKTIKEIRETTADKEKTKQLRAGLEKYSQQFESSGENFENEILPQNKKKKKEKIQPIDPVVESGPVKMGDNVRIIGQQNIGEVIELGEKEAMIAFGSIYMKAPLKKLEKISKTSIRTMERIVKVKDDFDINEKAAEFSPNLDIRGKRADDALIKARRFVDDAILLGVKQLKVVHGTGDGILREALRDYLRTLPELKRVRDEHPDRGGAGCTLIELR
jgi:DNA mismatch repair protein MutS2